MNSDATAPLHYDRMLVVLHWVLALGLIFQLGLGVWMEEIPKDPPGTRALWFNLHKSIGICLGFLILWRLGWRVTHSVPAPPTGVSTFQKTLGILNHRLLYVCMLVLPISGFMGSSFSPDGQKLYVAAGRSGSVSVVDIASRKMVKEIPTGKLPWGVVTH